MVQAFDKKNRSSTMQSTVSVTPILSNSQQLSVMMLVKQGLEQDNAVRIVEVMSEEDCEQLFISMRKGEEAEDSKTDVVLENVRAASGEVDALMMKQFDAIGGGLLLQDSAEGICKYIS